MGAHVSDEVRDAAAHGDWAAMKSLDPSAITATVEIYTDGLCKIMG